MGRVKCNLIQIYTLGFEQRCAQGWWFGIYGVMFVGYAFIVHLKFGARLAKRIRGD